MTEHRPTSCGSGRRGRAMAALSAAIVLLAPVLAGAAPATQPVPPVDDDIVFREALRSRGLNAWLELDLADHPPSDEVQARLRQRERLLAEAAAPGKSPADSLQVVARAAQILSDLIDGEPAHPDRLRWRCELARDYLERHAPGAFLHVLMYEMPGRQRDTVHDLSARAVEVLTRLRADIENVWRSAESIDEASLAVLRDTGSLAAMETLDNQSAMLLTWARFCHALTARPGDEQRRAGFTKVLAELTESGRLDLPPGREFEQCSALLMAAVAERHLRLLGDESVTSVEPDGRARQIIALQNRITDKSLRRRLRQTAAIAVLEQIRALRDARRCDDALQLAAQARDWALKSRPDEPGVFVAVSLLESTAIWRSQFAETSGAVDPSDSVAWLDCAACLEALQRSSRQSPAHRDALYETLAAASVPWPAAEVTRPFVLQLATGSTVAAFRSDPAGSTGVSALQAPLEATIASPRVASDAATAGELRFLLGEVLQATGSRLASVQVMTDLAEQLPSHDRADGAIRRAVALAGAELRTGGASGTPESRAAFLRAARIFRERSPADPLIPALNHAMAVALENDGRFQEAAVEYAAVPAGDERSRDAATGRLRCWRLVLDRAGGPTTRPVGTPDAALIEGARQALQAVRAQFAELSPTAPATSRPASGPADPSEDCGRARLLLAAVELLNAPVLNGAAEAIALLGDFEERFAMCPGLLGSALRQRILSLRQLKRLTEARSVVDRYLAADPERAGAAMAGLLQSMHEEILSLLEEGDHSGASTVAAEAVEVADSLLNWASQSSRRLEPADRLLIRTWRAAALLDANRPDEAIAAFEALGREARDSLPAASPMLTEINLGGADALLAGGRADEALATYAAVWQRAPEHSAIWWRAFVGSLKSHERLKTEPGYILQSIRQQRVLAPDLGGKRWQRELSNLEQALGQASRPAR